MGLFFGTDGIRGIFNKNIDSHLAYKCGNSLSNLCENKKVLIGRDCRSTSDILNFSFASGLMDNGVNVTDIGVTTTPSVAFLTKKYSYDFGVMITASHNPKEYNGIKIFDNDGLKINESLEKKIEKYLFNNYKSNSNYGKYSFFPQLLSLYIDEITRDINFFSINNIAFDCANGSASVIMKKIKKKFKWDIKLLNCDTGGEKINLNCGATQPEFISNYVKKHNCSMGVSFDGDADRIIICDENGDIIDGDKILFILSKFYQKDCHEIVSTILANKGFENALNKNNITLTRTDVGDKFVAKKMIENNVLLGGEPSGHIIIKDKSTTGDGVLVSLIIAKILQKYNIKLSKMANYKVFPQINCNLSLNNKNTILQNKTLQNEINKITKEMKNKGRIIVRASGTEEKLRLTCEHIDEKIAQEKIEYLCKIIKELC